MKVVDASVAVKWFLPEPGQQAAEALTHGNEVLLGPALLQVEVAAAIARKARFHEISSEEAEAAVGLWRKWIAARAVVLIPEGPDLAHALRLALELNHPLQDCLYLAMAKRLAAPLITADDAFAKKARRAYARVRSLG